jgi:hypothetical protein
VKLADQIRRICVERKENIVIEGTLTWAGQGPRIFRELADSEYVDVQVYGVDVDAATAHRQAVDHWWTERHYRSCRSAVSADDLKVPVTCLRQPNG